VNKLRKLPLRLVFLLAALSPGCDLPGRPSPANRSVPVDQVTDFGVLYTTRCAGCHGADGKLGPAPPLNDPIFLAIVTDAELLRVIAEGRIVAPGQKSPMPAFAHDRGGPLTGAQVKLLADGIKKRWASPASLSGTPPAYLGPATAGEGSKNAGARVFARACAGCHGSQGEGNEDGHALPGGAINNQSFLALTSDQALRRTIITGRPDLGMPAYDGKAGRPPDFRSLTAPEVNDLVALLRSWRSG
jgi:cytochrome c oxidase cbb3-type subunit 3/ubiquinol-cytochrome c reductase cytochrome c subunit